MGLRRAVLLGALGAAVVLLVAGPTAAVAGGGGSSTVPPTSLPMPTGPGAPTLQADVTYGRAGGQTLLLDVYQPATAGTNRPAVVLIHGGGWQVGDKSSAQPEAVALAQAGFVAFAPNYRLDAPDPWPAELQDVQQAVRWVQDNAATYGVDPTRIGAFGGSAGGNLAMLLGTSGVGGSNRPPVRAVVSWSGPSDLVSLSPTNLSSNGVEARGSVPGANRPAACGSDPNCVGVIDPSVVAAYIGCTVTQCPAQYRAASPVFHVTSSTPPMQLVSSVEDLVPITQAQEMADQLTRAGVSAQMLAVPGDAHADAYQDVATAPMVQFFTTYLVDQVDPHVPAGTPTTTWLPRSAVGALPESALFRGRALQVIVVVLALVAVAGLALVAVARARHWHPDLRAR
ncbi:MAG: alpha/beta hydrolase [Acidimicrobiales bacterium]